MMTWLQIAQLASAMFALICLWDYAEASVRSADISPFNKLVLETLLFCTLPFSLIIPFGVIWYLQSGQLGEMLKPFLIIFLIILIPVILAFIISLVILIIAPTRYKEYEASFTRLMGLGLRLSTIALVFHDVHDHIGIPDKVSDEFIKVFVVVVGMAALAWLIRKLKEKFGTR